MPNASYIVYVTGPACQSQERRWCAQQRERQEEEVYNLIFFTPEGVDAL